MIIRINRVVLGPLHLHGKDHNFNNCVLLRRARTRFSPAGCRQIGTPTPSTKEGRRGLQRAHTHTHNASDTTLQPSILLSLGIQGHCQRSIPESPQSTATEYSSKAPTNINSKNMVTSSRHPRKRCYPCKRCC